ncbi:TPA: hypothetical protein ACFIXM_000111 [Neisseria gonorrhoeae]
MGQVPIKTLAAIPAITPVSGNAVETQEAVCIRVSDGIECRRFIISRR